MNRNSAAAQRERLLAALKRGPAMIVRRDELNGVLLMLLAAANRAGAT